ncbi:MAG: DNA-packaging protein [Proteobacteria bacterium]|nr:DNA-packaging protein [Pseudomonadota bacterium]
MAAPEGNSFWKARSSHGRKPIFPTPDDLWDACVEYFEWVEANPLQSSELVAYQGAGKLVEVPKMRAMTITGLCIFLDIATSTWRSWADSKSDNKDLLAVTTRVDEVIRTQKFEGASAGFLNPNIIARDLGLADKSELTGANGGPIETKEVGKRELARRIALALHRGNPGASKAD